MNCEQAEELLGAYALDALDDAEMAAMRAHLASCTEHAAKAAELRAVATSLHAASDPMTPPAGLRGRIAIAVAEASPATTAQRAPVGIAPRREPHAASRLRRRPAMTFGALAAALAIIAGGLLAWNINLQNDNGGAPVSVVRPFQQETGATAGYIVLFDGGKATVVSDAMPLLDASQAYQIWSLDDAGQASSLGLMQLGEGGGASADVSFDPARTQQIAITIEPAGGSNQPTTPPLYIADVS